MGERDGRLEVVRRPGFLGRDGVVRGKAMYVVLGVLIVAGAVLGLYLAQRPGTGERLLDGTLWTPDTGGVLEATPACTPLAEVTPAACAIPGLPEGTPTAFVVIPLTEPGQPAPTAAATPTMAP
jgi:hypothetical protein